MTAVHNIVVSTGLTDLYAFANAIMDVPGFLGQLADPNASSEFEVGDALWPLSLAGRSLEVFSSHRVMQGLNDRADIRFYVAEPRVMIITQGSLTLNGTEHVYMQADVRQDRLRAIAVEDAKASEVSIRRLWFGVLEGVLESLLVEQFCAVVPPSERRIIGAGSRPLKDANLLTGSDVNEVDTLVTDTNVAAQIKHSLEAGDLIITTSDQSQAWWQVSPESGDARAILYPNLGGGYAYAAGEVLREAGNRIPLGRYRAPQQPAAPQGTIGPRTTWHIRQLPDGRILSASEADIQVHRARRLAAERARQASRFRRPPRTPRGGGGGPMGEYLMLILNVSVPTSVSLSVIGSTVTSSLTFAYFAFAREMRWVPFE